jgi:hypothetical protein
MPLRFVVGLGIRYLWIGALCIIQGVGGDWDEEATEIGMFQERNFGYNFGLGATFGAAYL